MKKEMSYDFYSPEKEIEISEAIVKRVPGNEIDSPQYIYDITFPETHVCATSFHMVVGGVICKSCYGRALGEKMRELTNEQRKPFLEYQINIHRNPQKWLKELSAFVTEFERAFEKKDFGLVPEWNLLLEEALNNKSITPPPWFVSPRTTLQIHISLFHIIYFSISFFTSLVSCGHEPRCSYAPLNEDE